jgi:hypothetical protein
VAGFCGHCNELLLNPQEGLCSMESDTESKFVTNYFIIPHSCYFNCKSSVWIIITYLRI